MLTTNNT